MTFDNSSSTTNIEFWFIPFDILKIVCTTFAIILAVLFFCTIILDKTCRTVPMMLVANSCLAELIFGCDMLSMAVFSLQNDLKQIQFFNSFCLFQGYMSYMSTGIQNYSYLLQAIYRYITVVYPTRVFCQSARFQFFLICLTWICSVLYPIPIVFTGQIEYHVDDQICQMPLRLSFITIFNAVYVYFFPMGSIMLIYFKLVRYVHEMSKRVTPVNTICRAQRELKMVRRIVLLVFILVTLGFPYSIFIFISFFTTPPKYHFRIAYIFVDVSLALVMVALFEITEPLKTSVMKKLNRPPMAIVPTLT